MKETFEFMNKKIDLSKILKDCPEGMELDCTMYDSLEFDSIDESISHRPIKCRIKSRYGGYNIHRFSKYGLYDDTPHSKCVIFPKGKTTWEGFQRPFINGDVIVDKTGAIAIYKQVHKSYEDPIIDFHCRLTSANKGLFQKNGIGSLSHCWEIDSARFASQEEKQKLFQAIEDNGYKWNAETKTLENIIKPKFENGDIVAYDNPYRDNLQLFIFKDKKENDTLSTCYLMFDDDELDLEEGMYYVTRLATEEEKQKLFQAIEDNGYKWNAETKTLEIKPKFENGDIIFTTTKGTMPIHIYKWLSIFKNNIDDKCSTYVSICLNDEDIIYKYTYLCNNSDIIEQRLATEEEKENFFDILKSKNFKWNDETKTLEKLIKPKFENGDIIFTITKGITQNHKWLSIFKNNIDGKFNTYVSIHLDDEDIIQFKHTYLCNNSDIIDQRLANQDEKQKLFDILKSKNYKWNDETKTLLKLIEPKVLILIK